MTIRAISHKRLLSVLIVLAILVSLAPVLPVMAAVTDPARVEVFLAADPASNNLSLDGFETGLKNDISSRYGYPADLISVTAVESQTYDASAIDWYEFDHTNNSSLATSTATSWIQYDTTYNVGEQVQDRHIQVSSDGKSIVFYGYGQSPYRDYLFNPDTNANNKVFTFTMNESAVSYHTLNFGGFLFNAKYTYNQSTGERLLSGYVIGVAQSNIYLYQIDNMSVSDIMAGTTDSTKFKLLKSVSKPAAVNNYRYLKLVASPTEVSLYQFTNNTYSTTTTGGKIIENYQLPANYNSFGYGPFAAYNSHYCSDMTKLPFTDLTLSTNTSTSFTDLVRSINWKYDDSLKLIVNVDNDGVKDFADPADLGTILYYTGLNNAHYIGWGVNNTISIGSDTSVMGQASSFITRNNSKGTTINRSNPATDSLAEGISVISDYILDKYDEVSPIDPPRTKLTFGSNGAIQIDVLDTETSALNPIGAYEWRYMDIASGTWQTSSTTSSTANFTFASGTYNMVTVRIQDSVTGVWSDYTIAYIANDSSVDPIAQFSLSANELLPDSSIDALKTGTSVAATDMSYHPAGASITGWEWKVYDSALNEISAMASTAQNPSFEFAGKPAGTYTIKLRVKKDSIWSSAYSQTVTVFLESDSISISRLTPEGTGPFSIMDGSASFSYSIGSTNPLSRYRVLRIAPGSSVISADGWQLASATTASGSGTVSTNNDIYVQALDSSGNSKIALIGEFRLDMVKPVLSLDTNGYEQETWSTSAISLNLTNTAANTSPVTMKYRVNNGAWTTFSGSLEITTDGTYTYDFQAFSTGGTASDVVSASVKVDRSSPTGVKIAVGDLTFDEYRESIASTYYFNTTLDLTFSAQDAISGMNKLAYQVLDRDAIYSADGPWIEGNAVSVDPNREFVVYLRATDLAGNQTIVNTEGLLTETTAPELSIFPASDMVLYKNSQELIRVDASDADSGLKQVTYTTDEESETQSGTITLANGVGYFSLGNDGSYTVVITAEDRSGNTTTINRGIKIDTVTPTLAISGNPTSVVASAKLTLTPTTGPSGVGAVTVSKDGGTAVSLTDTYASGYTVTSSGSYVFTITSAAGLSSQKTVDVTSVDSTQPVLQIDTHGYTGGTWIQGPVTVDFANSSANLGTTSYEISSDGTTFETIEGTQYIFDHEVNQTFYFRAISQSGIISEPVTLKVQIDQTAPGGTIAFKENSFSNFVNTISFGLFFNETIDVTIAGEDVLSDVANSGVATVEYQKVTTDSTYSAAGPWTTYEPFSISPDEQFVLYAQITDQAGNQAVIRTDGIIIDQTAPEIAITYASDDAWTTSAEASMAVVVSDNLVGLNWVRYSIGTADPVIASADFTISDLPDGNYKVKVETIDKAGNTAEESVQVKKDTEQPTIEASGAITEYLQQDQVELVITTGASGIQKVEVKQDSDDYADITSSYATGYLVTENGTYTFRITNGAGVTAEDSVTYSMLDSVVPILSIDVGDFASGVWSMVPVSLSLTNTSANLGSTAYQISSNGTDYTTVDPSEIAFSTDQSQTYYFRGISASGVIGEPTTFKVMIDQVVPAGTITIVENTFRQFLNSITFGLFFKDPIDVVITAEDVGHETINSGVANIEYQKAASTSDYSESGPWTGYERALEVSEGDQFIVYARITDQAGNVTIINTNGIVVDLTSPELALDPAVDMTDFLAADQTISVMAADSGSGLASVQFTTDETVPQTGVVTLDEDGQGSFTLANNGSYTLTVIAADNAGNTTSKTRLIKIDKITPDLEISGNPRDYVTSAILGLDPVLGPSGLKLLTVRKDGGAAKDITGSYDDGYKVSASGKYVFTITANNGLSSDHIAYVTKVDSLRPAVKLDSGTFVSGGWSSQPVTIQVSNTAGNLGTTRYEYAMSEPSSWQSFDGSLTVREDGSKTCWFRAISEAGLSSEPVRMVVGIDTQRPAAPVLELVGVNGGALNRFLSLTTFKLFFNETVRVTLSANDVGGGIQSISWRTSANAPFQSKPGNQVQFELPADYQGQITAYATDFAGLVSDKVVTDGIILDKGAPTIRVKTEKDAAKNQLRLSVNLADETSGLQRALVKIGAAETAVYNLADGSTERLFEKTLEWTIPVQSVDRADYDITIMAYDLSGNAQAVQMNIMPDILQSLVEEQIIASADPAENPAGSAESLETIRNMYAKMSDEEKVALDPVLASQIETLLGLENSILTIVDGDLSGLTDLTYQTPTVTIKDLASKLSIPELADPNTESVTIRVQVDVVESDAGKSFLITARDALSGHDQQLLQVLDLSLIKLVKTRDGQETTVRIDNADIKEELTVLIPLPEQFKDRSDLVIFYIDDVGLVTEYDTVIVEENGQKFLQFKTGHFSTYAIAGKTGRDFIWLIYAAGGFILLGLFFLILFFWRRRKEDEEEEVGAASTT